jgi:hypothetical protein
VKRYALVTGLAVQQNDETLESPPGVMDMSEVESRRFRRVAAELVVIVVGVLMALWIDAGWGWLQDRQDETQILADLEADFSANLTTIDSVAIVHGALIDGVPMVIENGAEGLDDSELFGAFLSIATNETFIPRMGALEAAIAAGRINLIRDPELRSALTGWGHFVVEAQEEIEWAAPARDGFLDAIAIDLGGGSEAELNPADLRGVLNRIRDEPDLQRDLIVKRLWTVEGRADFEALRTETVRILNLIGGG